MTITITVPILGTAHDAAYFQPAELTAADLFAFAYTDGPHAYSIATINAIRAKGHGICWNHERGQLDLAGGAPAGTLAANEAMPAVVAAGTPLDGTIAIVYSVDGSVTQADFSKYVPAFQAIRVAHAGRFLIGFYGELALYKYLKALGLVDVKCWLSASSSFPGYNPNDPDVGVIQTVGTDIASTDRDLVTDAAHLGVWYPPGSPYAPKPPPLKETDMLLVQVAPDPANPNVNIGIWLIGGPNGYEHVLDMPTDSDLIAGGVIQTGQISFVMHQQFLAGAAQRAQDSANLAAIAAALSNPAPITVDVPVVNVQFPSFTLTGTATPEATT